jgi:DNA-binding IclR family transcriptional regulator
MTKTIKSDERLLEILEVLKDRGGAGVTEVAEITGLPKSTVHIHLATLEEKNFAVKENGTYRISLRFLDFGKAAQKHNALYDVVVEKVDELARETDEQAWCLVEEQNQAYYLYGSHGSHAIRTHSGVGKHEALPNLAGGRAILANLPEDRRKQIIDECELDDNRNLPFSSKDELREQLETIREEGIAFNSESYVKGVNAIGAPIIDNTGEVYGALSIAGPANRLKEDLINEEVADLLLGVTNELGVNLTYS